MNGPPEDAGEPGELLHALRPYPVDEYLAPGDDPGADALLRHVMSLDIDGHKRHSRGRRVAVLAIAITVVGASATAALVTSRSAGNRAEVSCYSSADVHAAKQVVLSADSRRTPLDQCADLWSDGHISSGGAPALVACVTSADIVAVVPGDNSTCTTHGWAVAVVATEPTEDPAPALTSTLSDRFAGQCLDPDSAAQAVAAVLADLHATDWSVHDGTANPDWCAVPVVDVASRTVELVSHPG